MSQASESQGVPGEIIERRIYLIRGQKVMLDADIAALYQVPTKRLNEAVKRNLGRFPEDFMFQLTESEAESSRSQIATLNEKGQGANNLKSQIATSSWGGRRKLPYAFTEHGVMMLSSVLNSERAIQVNIHIVRAFVRIRELLASNKELAARVEKLEAGQQEQNSIIHLLAKEIDGMKNPPEPKRRGIGFTARWDE